MLSVRQDAMFGAGHAKWGPLDPSIVVLRPRPGALTFARAWRAWLLAEAEAEAEAGAEADRRVLVQGVHVPLRTPLVWLFEACSYPDGFLYVCCKVGSVS